MAKIAIVMPREEMKEQALSANKDYNLNVMSIQAVKTEEIEDIAKKLVKQGADIIIARGLQAARVKKYVSIPIIEIRLTAQELGILIIEMKRMLNKKNPKIAIIGFANMICDLTRLPELFEVEINPYFLENASQNEEVFLKALGENVDAFIGGDVICALAEKHGMPYIFLRSGRESIDDAYREAKRVAYAIDMEKRNTAELSTLLDYSFNGIIKVDKNGIILQANHFIEKMLDKSQGKILGKSVPDLIPSLDKELLSNALVNGKETFSVILDISHTAIVTNIAPVHVDGEINGAILTFHEGKSIIKMEAGMRREMYRRGFIAKYSFKDIACQCKETKALIEQAKTMAKYTSPILIKGETGTEKEMIAQCIHKESMYWDNRFIAVDCSAWRKETLDEMLFGNYENSDEAPSLVELAKEGTLFLENVEKLDNETQYKLLNLIEGKFMQNGDVRPLYVEVRVLASTALNLAECVEKGLFREDLFYKLSVLTLELLPLRQRKKEINYWANFYINEQIKKYNRFIKLTQGAYDFLENYEWSGNLEQLKTICERIVLLANKRSVDEVFLAKQLEQITPPLRTEDEKIIVFKDKNAEHIAQLLSKYQGNREKVARELGISKTTLWRYMKKYNIGADFSF